MKSRFLAMLLLAPVLAGAVAFGADSAVNATALHDPRSKSYDSRCLTCHDSVLKQVSSDPRVAAFHSAMLPYTPGFNPRKGAQDKNCIYCHNVAIDFQQKSGASIRRTVSTAACVNCHGRSGPGPVYYQ
jgi:cytochrome c553